MYDSDNELNFVDHFEKNKSIKVYTKMPGWFKINTPLGEYRTDRALLMEKDCDLKLYFVLETKVNVAVEALRPTAHAKIKCGKVILKLWEMMSILTL